jgi:hypothetical protein
MLKQQSLVILTICLRAAPPPPPPNAVLCFDGGDDCSDYEGPFDPCNTFTCAWPFHQPLSSPDYLALVTSEMISPLACFVRSPKHRTCVREVVHLP